MITITAEIKLVKNSGTINGASTAAQRINVSSEISEVVNQGISANNPFILGKSRLGSGATYSNNLPYFVSRELSNSNGEFSLPIRITISGNRIKSATYVFDKENDAHPNSILVEGATYSDTEEIVYDDDGQFQVVFDNAVGVHTIRISNWNKPFSPLILTAIYADINIDIDRNNLLSFNSNIFDRATLDEPSYGIISNSANLTFADLDEQALDLINQQILKSGVGVEVWIEDTNRGKQEQVCLMETRELFYDTDNRAVQVLLKDNLEEWQQIDIEGINYFNADGTPKEPKTAKWYYEYLYSKTPSKYNMLTFFQLDEDTQVQLNNTVIPYPVLESGTLWDSWDKLCELCLLHIYSNYEGKTVCVYNKGN